MQLLPVDSPERLQLVAHWLAQKQNYRWLDFGDGRQLTPQWLKLSMKRGSHVLRIFTPDSDDTPIGVVGLSNVNHDVKTASIWVVLGDKTRAGRGYATTAASRMLTIGFEELGLRAINTWIAEHNPSIHVARQLKFRLIGRQRQSHCIGGRVCDRLWFDLLASEYQEMRDGTYQRSA
jgi:RimJ/RimL family protein N-acetyltransferase